MTWDNFKNWLLDTSVTQSFFFILWSLLIIALLLWMQVWVLTDLLLIFVLLDLVITIFAVLFAVTGLFFQELTMIMFFFPLLTLAACETAIALGLIVSIWRRSDNDITTKSLSYLSL